MLEINLNNTQKIFNMKKELQNLTTKNYQILLSKENESTTLKWFVVFKGRNKGIFFEEDLVLDSIKGFENAECYLFKNLSEAHIAYSTGWELYIDTNGKSVTVDGLSVIINN